MCSLRGQLIAPNSAFVNIGPTNWNDPSQPKSKRYVPEDTDIHGWSPFVVAHPDCFAQDEGDEALRVLIAKESRSY